VTDESELYRTKQKIEDDDEALLAQARAAWEAKHPGEPWGQDDDWEDEDEVNLTATAVTYRTLNEAYDLFNQSLFAGELPEVLITMQRSRRSRGFFSSRRFAHRRAKEVLDEVALNPATFENRTDREIASTLVHEMTHVWQHHFGQPSRNGYHNREWANKMIEIGLMPSRTGKPGGKKTGQTCSHYIIDGGVFDREWQLMAESGFRFDYQDRPTNGPETPAKLKLKYTCPGCSISVWGKPGLGILCETCGERLATR
jgi:SprT-like family